ncbi:MAG TPA: transposase [Patescibacteria group bacterium]|nr:transposase [Patescibacteria group bacterium]
MTKNGCVAHVYLFMPDHVHLLVEGQSDESDLWKCIVDFKQSTGYWLSSTGREERWQHDFYDHLLRRDVDVEKQVRYILENPVRAGIVQDWKQYPYKGSTMCDFSKW